MSHFELSSAKAKQDMNPEDASSGDDMPPTLTGIGLLTRENV